MIYLWITYNSLMMYLWFTYDLLMITYVHLLYLWFTNVVGRFRSAQPYSRAIHSELLAGGPLEGSAVDVPPSIAVTTVLLRLAGCARKVWSLIAHGERDGSSFTHRHKSQPPQDWSYGNDIQDLWLHTAFVNYFGVAFIQPCCHYIQPSMISEISKINLISITSNISYSPGRWWPEYSSSTETNAHECLFSPTSVLDSTWNKRSILQNQMLSIRSSKAPWDIPGGRMKTKSWRLDFLGFFPANGQQEMRCSFGCFVCPIARVLKIAIWPVPSVEHNFLKVSSRALFCK